VQATSIYASIKNVSLPLCNHSIIMEPEVSAFLKRILNTMSMCILWMLLNATFGIMYGHAFVEDKIKMDNIIFYCWFLISLALLIWYVIRLWSKPIDIPK
jgi:ABC-type glycerol-3-phosphate transport system permease component